MSLVDLVYKAYKVDKYNCSEAILVAANDYYQLGLPDDMYKLVSGFGAGMFSGEVCGALSSSVAVVSKLLIETKAREQMDELKPRVRLVVKNFEEHLKGKSCKQLRPLYFTKEEVCLKTTLLAAEALEKSIREIFGDIVKTQ